MNLLNNPNLLEESQIKRKNIQNRFVYPVISNGNRRNKINRKRQKRTRNHATPEYYFKMNSTYNVHLRMMNKFNFNINIDNNNIHLRHKQKQFQEKMFQYLTMYGGGFYVKKRTRFDKMKFKQENSFDPKRNPIIILQSIGDKIKKSYLQSGFIALKTKNEDLKKQKAIINKNNDSQQKSQKDQNKQQQSSQQQTNQSYFSHKIQFLNDFK